MTKTEILAICNTKNGDKKIIAFQYETGSKLLETMLQRFRKWGQEGKMDIIDIRTPAQYHYTN